MNVILLQLPIPRLELGRQTGSVPLGAACLAAAAADVPGAAVTVLPESRAAFLGDAALIEEIVARRPDIVGFSVFCWNVKRTLYVAERIKAACGARIVLGGPEVTPDNPTIASAAVDALVCGEGEAVFRRLLTDGFPGTPAPLSAPAGPLFTHQPSPYLAGWLEPEIENLMLLETQRGCPYRCGYCYYNKAIGRRSVAETDTVLAAVRWAVDLRLKELFFLDPSLNARPDLPAFLEAVAAINREGSVSLLSEIRAEAITPALADGLAAAGFTWLEIGLQSVNPRAQKIMNRPTRLPAFLRGIDLLRQRGIAAGVDLIAGLPGDDPAGFRASVDFMADHALTDDVQVFPLSILPGTDFRRRAGELGIVFDPEPPYPVLRTGGFTGEDLLESLAYAQDNLGTVLYPMADLNLHHLSRRPDAFTPEGHYRPPALIPAIGKLLFRAPQPLGAVADSAHHLTHPYQVFFWPAAAAHADFLDSALKCVTEANPFTPLEIVFMGWAPAGGAPSLLPAVRLRRPHYLDLDLRYRHDTPGNRAVLLTLVSPDPRLRFTGDMARQVFWWREDRLPEASDLAELESLDGVLIDTGADEAAVCAWQDHFAADSAEILAVTFSGDDHHRRWISLTAGRDYFLKAL